MHIDSAVLTLIAGTLVPLATGLVSKQSASSGLKAVINVFLSAVAAVALQANAHNGLVTQDTLVQGYQVFIAGIASYYGFLKPRGVASKVSGITGERGIG